MDDKKSSSASIHTCMELGQDDDESEILVFKDPISPEDIEPPIVYY